LRQDGRYFCEIAANRPGGWRQTGITPSGRPSIMGSPFMNHSRRVDVLSYNAA
jgi:hypothetical protein